MTDTHELLAPSRLRLAAVLDALLEARSVSRAAAAAGMTQSGMSHALAESFTCVLRRGHEALRGPLDREAYLRLEHALVTTGGAEKSAVDRYLESIGRARRIALRVGYFLVAPMVAARSDLVVTLPARPAAILARGLPVELRPLPLPIRGGPVLMVWHERFKNDPFSRWVRAELHAAGEEARSEAPAGADPPRPRPAKARARKER